MEVGVNYAEGKIQSFGIVKLQDWYLMRQIIRLKSRRKR